MLLGSEASIKYGLQCSGLSTDMTLAGEMTGLMVPEARKSGKKKALKIAIIWYFPYKMQTMSHACPSCPAIRRR